MIIKALHRQVPDVQTHLEQPGRCGSWRGELYTLKEDYYRWTAVADGCAYGLRDSDTGLLNYKRWHLNSSDRNFCKYMEKVCSRDHVHQPLEGIQVTLSASYPTKMVQRLANYMVKHSKLAKVSEIHALLGTDDDVEMIPRVIRESSEETGNLLTKTNQDKATAIVMKLHKNMNHASVKTLISALSRGRIRVESDQCEDMCLPTTGQTWYRYASTLKLLVINELLGIPQPTSRSKLSASAGGITTASNRC